MACIIRRVDSSCAYIYPQIIDVLDAKIGRRAAFYFHIVLPFLIGLVPILFGFLNAAQIFVIIMVLGIVFSHIIFLDNRILSKNPRY